MKKINLFSITLLSIIILGGCNSNNDTTSSSSVMESSTKYSSTSTSESTISSESVYSSISSSSSSTEETSSSVDTESIDVENNADDTVSYDSATQTFTTPISKIKLEGQEFNYIKRGSASEPVFVIKYSVENISDEVFSSANSGSNRYIEVTSEEAGKRFSGLAKRVMTDTNDPAHLEYENLDKRLEQRETLTLAEAYSLPENVKKIYIEFKDTRGNAVKRLQVDIPESVQQEVINYVP